MKKKIIFLDRDGVLNKDTAYLYKIEDLEWMPHIIDALALGSQAGYEYIVVTNQSGVARGYYSEEDVLKLHHFMSAYLASQGVPILAFYYCPHLPEGTVEKYAIHCDCRKPASGLLAQAFNDFSIDIKESFMIGDRQRDVSCAENFGIKGYLFDGKNILECMSTILEERTHGNC